MATSDRPAPDPRFRSFRVAMYVSYLLVVGAFSTLIIVSVLRSVAAMTPKAPEGGSVVLSARECVGRAERLWSDLEERRKDLASSAHRTEAGNAWAQFRVTWLERLRDSEASCALDSRERAALKAVFKRLDKAMDLYTTHATQYAGEVGPTADALHQELELSRKQAQ